VTRSLLYSTATGLCLALAIFALATQRSLRTGADEMRASDVAFDAGRLEEAVRHARRAATSYVPGAAHVDAAYARLRAVALGAERARNAELARTAWRAVRAAVIESRHIWSPNSTQLERADQNLARLGGSEEPAVGAGLGSPPAPHPLWVLTLALGFSCTWIGLGLLFWQGMDAAGRWRAARARLPALLFVAGLIAFGLALARA
jgi:hypothetical protein